ncbi:MAG: hypothetical protein RLZZ399_1587 [Verrucomicrobiota bacterium]|jgi:hypothetical protein
MARGAVARHERLQRYAFRWALEQGFKVAALDVPVSRIGGRLDVAACKFEPVRRRRGTNVLRAASVIVFECKADRDDFLRDARSEEETRRELESLQKRRAQWEAALRRDFPTLREGETLFPEYDVYRFEEVGGAQYGDLMREIGELSQRLYVRSKFAKLARWKAGNLQYVVAESGVVRPEELPLGWGLLEPHVGGAEVVVKAVWQDVPDANRWLVAMNVAEAVTQAFERAAMGLADLF